jgi:hypothetical protein
MEIIHIGAPGWDLEVTLYKPENTRKTARRARKRRRRAKHVDHLFCRDVPSLDPDLLMQGIDPEGTIAFLFDSFQGKRSDFVQTSGSEVK